MAVEAPKKRSCAVLALTQGGCTLGQRLAKLLQSDFFTCKGQLREVFTLVWQEYQEIVCIMATGIVVRTIAPLLQDKYHDPAVVVCDEQGKFAISLISGHLGGANQLAERVAADLGGQAVLTTASDVLGLTALDLWCRDLGLTVSDKSDFTRAMGKLVDQGSLTVASDYPLPHLPPDLEATTDREGADLLITASTDGPAGTALLHPKALVFGIGCNRGTPATVIARAVAATCAQHQLAPEAIARLASIDLKKDEQGLLDFGRKQGLAIDFFPSDQLNQIEGVDTSPAVLRATGAKAVAEPAALLSGGAGSTLLIKKMKWTDVTTAVAEIADPLAITTLHRKKGTTQQ